MLTAETEGAWDEVMAVIGKAHTVVHRRGVFRVQSSMRVGSRYDLFFSFIRCVGSFPVYSMCLLLFDRTDKKQTAQDKVQRVNDILASDA